ncbi:MAG: ribonuclease H family protein, partial [Verrucomicrobiota bacterium]
VCAYLDDLLVTGRNPQEHMSNLEEVLKRLDDAGLRLNREKCTFMSSNVEYLGHRIDAEGLHPTKRKLEAIMKAPVPTDVSQLKAYLGLINYYGRFMRNLSSELAPLHELLQKQVEFHWSDRQQKAFEKSKRMIESSQLLVFYDPDKPLVLTTDASSYGLGAVLSHTIDGIERSIYCVSRTLSPSEKNYSQLEKESLSVVFGVKRFHQFLYGRHFSIRNDHRPLEGLLSEKKGIPVMASGRIRRWALTLSAYDYEFRYKAGTSIPCADALSRLPIPSSNLSSEVPVVENVHSFEFLSGSEPLNAREIESKTQSDPVLAKTMGYVRTGL